MKLDSLKCVGKGCDSHRNALRKGLETLCPSEQSLNERAVASSRNSMLGFDVHCLLPPPTALRGTLCSGLVAWAEESRTQDNGVVSRIPQDSGVADVAFELEAMVPSNNLSSEFQVKQWGLATVFTQQQKSTCLIMSGESQCLQMKETVKQNPMWRNSWCRGRKGSVLSVHRRHRAKQQPHTPWGPKIRKGSSL